MNIDGYRMYLQSLGNFNKFIDKEISSLVSIEQSLNVDIDDFIPYDGKYSRLSELEADMIAIMRYDEDVQSSLNRYVGYKLHSGK